MKCALTLKLRQIAHICLDKIEASRFVHESLRLPLCGHERRA